MSATSMSRHQAIALVAIVNLEPNLVRLDVSEVEHDSLAVVVHREFGPPVHGRISVAGNVRLDSLTAVPA